MDVKHFDDGFVILGRFPDREVLDEILLEVGKAPLSIADPPYGNITEVNWDKVGSSDLAYAEKLTDYLQALTELQHLGSVSYWWGGIGRNRFRPFFKMISLVEEKTPWRMLDLVTWKKRRGYGTQHRYLFIREELAYFCLDYETPTTFNIPYLDKERGYPGYNKKYPARSKYLRRGNVWTDVGEILSRKTHITEKPQRLSEIIIEAHTSPGDYVLDLFSGSGSCSMAARALGRKFVAVENDPEAFDKIIMKLHGFPTPDPVQIAKKLWQDSPDDRDELCSLIHQLPESGLAEASETLREMVKFYRERDAYAERIKQTKTNNGETKQ